MKVLVTGAAGFIGFHVSQYLCNRGDEVVGIDNLNDYYEVSLKEARLEQLEQLSNGPSCSPSSAGGSALLQSIRCNLLKAEGSTRA
ncbi:NAD-dependent epimerase/dehydratase family protein [Marinobacterium sp. xm-a-152]|uniref:NAD-dependent epimerase/dehydratase family protein n=1 Tax=Marinobacterium sp. xm-a-152 TaxID=2497733 RepID=UPI0019F03A2A|nr:hypothetical protein [Marinobacterium sp. xm-a-152]